MCGYTGRTFGHGTGFVCFCVYQKFETVHRAERRAEFDDFGQRHVLQKRGGEAQRGASASAGEMEVHRRGEPLVGGFWERLVQTVKRSLRKVLFRALVNYEWIRMDTSNESF